ncbi:hypothetical protein C4565_00450 [Candidatus Parcubacteria bacterium]|nr:MAG: hypothetical protein C4565_00450 [Candidatus Parcubacteria bacterium]
MKYTILFETEHFPQKRYYRGWAARPTDRLIMAEPWAFDTKEEAEEEMFKVEKAPDWFAGEAKLSVVPIWTND